MVTERSMQPFIQVSKGIFNFSDKWLKVITYTAWFGMGFNAMVLLLHFLSGIPELSGETLFERAAIFFSVAVFLLSALCLFFCRSLDARATYYVEKFSVHNQRVTNLFNSELRNNLRNMTYFGTAFTNDVSGLLIMSISSVVFVVWVAAFAMSNHLILAVGAVMLVLVGILAIVLVRKDVRALRTVFDETCDVEF